MNARHLQAFQTSLTRGKGIQVARFAAAQGYFPGVELEEPQEPPSRGSLIERLQEIPDHGTEEHTEEVKLLREQTALLAQELRLLREILQDGALADVIADLTTQQVDASPVAEVKDEEALKSTIPPADGMAMSELLVSKQVSYRHEDALQVLNHLSKRVVERRVEGELPLGQVPNVG